MNHNFRDTKHTVPNLHFWSKNSIFRKIFYSDFWREIQIFDIFIDDFLNIFGSKIQIFEFFMMNFEYFWRQNSKLWYFQRKIISDFLLFLAPKFKIVVFSKENFFLIFFYFWRQNSKLWYFQRFFFYFFDFWRQNSKLWYFQIFFFWFSSIFGVKIQNCDIFKGK